MIPLTEAQLESARSKMLEDLRRDYSEDEMPEITCDSCDLRFTCEFSYDTYNTHGDCLAEK